MNNPAGGAERVLADIANALAMRGHAVKVLTFERPGSQSFYSLDPRIERVELAIGDTAGPVTLRETLQRIASLRSYLKADLPDAVIGFMHSIFISLGVAALGTRVPVIASENIIPIHDRSRPLEALLFRLTPCLVDCITCASDRIKRSYPKSIQRKMLPVANPVSAKAGRFANVGGLVGRPKTLLSVGRLDEQQDFATLIEAFSLIHVLIPEWRLRIVGEGHLRGDLEKLISELRLSAKVSLPGVTQDVQAEYSSAQLFVLPSRNEGLGLATAEALMHGLPAVGFADCPGANALIVRSVNGELAGTYPDRVTALAAVLAELMTAPGLRQRLSKGARLTGREFRIEAVVTKWEGLIEATCVKRASAEAASWQTPDPQAATRYRFRSSA
ncbi:MAG: glycosyltransferase [Hyphomicrobium sp.]